MARDCGERWPFLFVDHTSLALDRPFRILDCLQANSIELVEPQKRAVRNAPSTAMAIPI
jgi:hypothetical protein